MLIILMSIGLVTKMEGLEHGQEDGPGGMYILIIIFGYENERLIKMDKGKHDLLSTSKLWCLADP